VGNYPTIAIATCAAFPDLDADDLPLLGLLGEWGVQAQPAVWDDPDRLPDFLSWAGRLPRVLNPLPVLRWNCDKRYLEDLAAAGLPEVPTRFLGPGEPFEPPAAGFVVKPAVSCGCRDTARYSPGRAGEAREHVRRLHSQGRTAMVQPYLAGASVRGEIDLVFLGGRFSHAVRRVALLEGGEPDPRGEPRPCRPTAEQLALAERVMGAVPGGPPLYGRVDLLTDAERGPVVLELESLFLEHGVGSAGRLADLVAQEAATGRALPC
jgi:hypothetical protein